MCDTGRCGDGQLCGESRREEVEQDVLYARSMGTVPLQVQHSQVEVELVTILTYPYPDISVTN